jgi:hypothetical protein
MATRRYRKRSHKHRKGSRKTRRHRRKMSRGGGFAHCANIVDPTEHSNCLNGVVGGDE